MPEVRSTRGFASPNLTPDLRREISRRGGQSVAREKRFFARDPEKAKEAGRKGGMRRREANAQETALLRESLTGPVAIPFGASGRTLRKVARLMRLGYWESAEGHTPECHFYQITEAGLAFLTGQAPKA